MNTHDVIATRALVTKIWTKCQWPQELSDEFTRRLNGLDLEYVQARAAMLNLAMERKYQTVSPAELLEALGKALVVQKKEAPKAPEIGKREAALSLDLRLQELPIDLQHAAMFRIDDMIHQAKDLTRVGVRLKDAALLAETDWIGALECAPFRYEVKQHPAVKKWLEQQPHKPLQMADFEKVSTTA